MQLNRSSGKLPYQWQATLSRACWNWGGSQEWWWRRVREGEQVYYAALEAAYECEIVLAASSCRKAGKIEITI